jgi:hypothetical protein
MNLWSPVSVRWSDKKDGTRAKALMRRVLTLTCLAKVLGRFVAVWHLWSEGVRDEAPHSDDGVRAAS